MGPFLVIGLVSIAAVAGGNTLLGLARNRPAVTTRGGVLDDPLAVIPPPIDGELAARRDRRRRRLAARLLRRPSAGTLLFWACALLYAGVGAYLVIHAGSIVGDAESRVADGFYVFFSRDPHVAAIGFVWNPLPSVAAMPFFALKGLFPVLTRRAYAGCLMSALFMAGSVVQLRAAVREAGASTLLTRVLVAAYALNPMVVYYGANGMSEAPYLFFLIVAVRYLARWVGTDRLGDLVWAGVALGACYLARYEAGIAALGGVLVVGLVSYGRRHGTTARRAATALTDVVVFVIPFAAAFVGWAVTSYVITGSAFQYITSQYGNTSQVKTVGVNNLPGHGTGLPLAVFVGLQLLSFAPLLPILAVAAVMRARRTRDHRVLVPIVLLGGIAAFICLTFVTGTTFGWLRLHLPTALLGALCVAYLFASPPTPAPAPTSASGSAATSPTSRPRRRAVRLGGALVGCLIAVTAVPTTAWAMSDHRLGVGEVPQLRWVVQPDHISEGDRNTKAMVHSAAAIARQLDSLGLPPGSIITDTFTPCVSLMLMNSAHPHQFVITSDRDFQRALADPVTFKVHYVLLPPPDGYGALDAVTQSYPTLYEDGAKGARLVRTITEPGCPAFRLYRVLQPGQH